MLEKLKDAILTAPIVKHGDKYDIYPPFGSLTIDPFVVEEIVTAIYERMNKDITKIAVVESMGIAVGTALSLKTNIPYVIVRKRKYGFPTEVSVSDLTGYKRATYYLNGIDKSDKLLLFDDIINTGETIAAIAKAIESVGAEIKDIIVVIDKGSCREEVEKQLNMKIKYLLKIKFANGKVEILS